MENIDLIICTSAVVFAFVILIVGTFGEFKKEKND